MKTFLAAATAAALSLCALTTAHATDKQTNSRDTIVFMQDAELNTVEGAALLLKAFPAKKHQGNASIGSPVKRYPGKNCQLRQGNIVWHFPC